MARITCLDCDWVDRDIKDGKVWCKKYHMYVYAEDADRCKFFELPRRSGGPCYLTTACCDVMGLEDDCFELESMRSLRDDYILKDIESGKDIVEDYYNTAPVIIDKINETDDATNTWKSLYRDEIVPCAELVKNGEFEKAYQKYLFMTEKLKKEYC